MTNEREQIEAWQQQMRDQLDQNHRSHLEAAARKLLVERRSGQCHYRVEWSEADQEYVCLVEEFPSLSWLAPTAGEAERGARELVREILDEMRDC